jgi:hypothetical protein
MKSTKKEIAMFFLVVAFVVWLCYYFELSSDYLVEINGHEYIKTYRGGITHSQSCHCLGGK